MKRLFFATCWTALACMDLAAARDEVSYSRQRLFSGFDGKTCKIQPSIATDGSGTVLLSWQNLLLTGSDVDHAERRQRHSQSVQEQQKPIDISHTSCLPYLSERERLPLPLAPLREHRRPVHEY